MVKRTKAELEGLMTPRGGWTKATLKMLGVPWPPPKGWKKALERGEPIPKTCPTFGPHSNEQP